MKLPSWLVDLCSWIFWFLVFFCFVAGLVNGCERLLFP